MTPAPVAGEVDHPERIGTGLLQGAAERLDLAAHAGAVQVAARLDRAGARGVDELGGGERLGDGVAIGRRVGQGGQRLVAAVGDHQGQPGRRGRLGRTGQQQQQTQAAEHLPQGAGQPTAQRTIPSFSTSTKCIFEERLSKT